MKLKSINRKLQILLLTALLSIVLIGCFKSSKPAAAPPRVTTTAIKQQDVPIYIDAIGKVIAPVTINIRPQASY
jgi:multidrug efflux pump subunit AcrA (membrane-fusion protein)